MTIALRGPSKALGLVDVSFGYLLAGMFVSSFSSMDLLTRVALAAFVGGLVGSALVVLDPTAPLFYLVWRFQEPSMEYYRHYLIEQSRQEQSRQEQELRSRDEPPPLIQGAEDVVSSPFLSWSRAKITATLYLLIALLLAWFLGKLQVLGPFLIPLVAVGFASILLKLIFELLKFRKKAAAVFVYDTRIAYQENLEEVRGMGEALLRQDWCEAQAWSTRLLTPFRISSPNKPAKAGTRR